MPNKTLALIPVYNEASSIGGVIDGARPYLSILVVDDGSTDETAGRAEEHNITVLRQQPNQGTR